MPNEKFYFDFMHEGVTYSLPSISPMQLRVLRQLRDKPRPTYIALSIDLGITLVSLRNAFASINKAWVFPIIGIIKRGDIKTRDSLFLQILEVYEELTLPALKRQGFSRIAAKKF